MILDGHQMDFIGRLTELEEAGAESAKVMLDIFAQLVAEIKRCGGTVQCEIGDGELFNLPLKDYI